MGESGEPWGEPDGVRGVETRPLVRNETEWSDRKALTQQVAGAGNPREVSTCTIVGAGIESKNPLMSNLRREVWRPS